MCSTKSMLRVILFIEIILVLGVCSDEGKRYCGSRLTKKLQTVCRHKYASPLSTDNENRSGDNDVYANINNEPLADNSPLSYKSLPILGNFGSSTAVRFRVRRDYWYLQRGVADECCRKRCNDNVLKSYCY